MAKSDQQLGMDRAINRRDFIHDAALTALASALPVHAAAQASTSPGPLDYPPVRTGLRGSHPGAFETAHALAREGKTFPTPLDLDEEYDLVVVGAGLSGLSAARFYQQRFGKSARILLLENHDDFGGHAKRNEFHQGGQMRLAIGGTHNMEHWKFSRTVKELMSDLGVNVKKLRKDLEFRYGRNGRNGPSIFFDADTYGINKLVTHCDLESSRESETLHRIDEFPMSEEARQQLKAFYGSRTDVLEHLSEDEAERYLRSISYPEFLRKYAALDDEAISVLQQTHHGGWGLGLDVLSAAEAIEDGSPGLQLLGYDSLGEEWGYPAAFYPDGNASLARLLVQKLISQVSPGANADNIAVADFDYQQLDRAAHAVRLRLNSTVVHVENGEENTHITYASSGKVFRVQGRHCVMACYHTVIPHLCPALPETQKSAMKYQVKMPMLLTNVLIRSSEPMERLGITGAYCPGRMHASLFMSRGINTGGYTHRMNEQGPVSLTFWGTIASPPGIEHIHSQLKASRARMLELNFEDYEREVRTVADGLLGPAGFDVEKDILAITVNRWPHGYAYEYMDLWDPDYAEGEAPHEIARKPFGNITFANSDAGASAYTHVAIDEAYRAVGELS